MSETAVSFALEQLEPSAPPREEAARLLADAESGAAAIVEEARRRGFEEGRGAGLAAAAAEIAGGAAALAAALVEVQEMRGRVAEEVEREAVQLALALAGKILTSTLQIRPELVVEVLEGALKRVSGERTMTVVVNPADLETVRAAMADLQSPATGAEHWDLQADQRVPAGGAIVRTDQSEVDARIETQIERAHEVVVAEIGPRELEP